jgi:hypothetical protein
MSFGETPQADQSGYLLQLHVFKRTKPVVTIPLEEEEEFTFEN